MAAKVTFVNRDDKSQILKVNLLGPDKKRVKVANILACLNSKMAIMEDGCILEADDDGLSMDTFDAGATYMLSLVPYSIVALPHIEVSSKLLHPSEDKRVTEGHFTVNEGHSSAKQGNLEPGCSLSKDMNKETRFISRQGVLAYSGVKDPYQPGNYSQQELYERIYKKAPSNMTGFLWGRNFLREYHPLQWKVYKQNVSMVRSWFYDEDVADIATLLKNNLRNQQGMAEKVKAYIKTREPSLSALLFQSSGSMLLVRWQVDEIYEWFKGHKHYFGAKTRKTRYSKAPILKILSFLKFFEIFEI